MSIKLLNLEMNFNYFEKNYMIPIFRFDIDIQRNNWSSFNKWDYQVPYQITFEICLLRRGFLVELNLGKKIKIK